MTTHVLKVHEVSKSFGGTRALDGVSWQVPGRGVHGLVGPNGAGKTTLYGVVCGFLRADAGEVLLGGETVSTIHAPPPGLVGLLPQDAMMPVSLPVGTTLAYSGRLLGLTRVKARAEAARVLGLVGLGDASNKKPKTLSHGMYKRVAIAQAFMNQPRLVLLDEPTAGLDPMPTPGAAQAAAPGEKGCHGDASSPSTLNVADPDASNTGSAEAVAGHAPLPTDAEGNKQPDLDPEPDSDPERACARTVNKIRAQLQKNGGSTVVAPWHMRCIVWGIAACCRWCRARTE